MMTRRSVTEGLYMETTNMDVPPRALANKRQNLFCLKPVRAKHPDERQRPKSSSARRLLGSLMRNGSHATLWCQCNFTYRYRQYVIQELRRERRSVHDDAKIYHNIKKFGMRPTTRDNINLSELVLQSPAPSMLSRLVPPDKNWNPKPKR